MEYDRSAEPTSKPTMQKAGPLSQTGFLFLFVVTYGWITKRSV